MLPHTSYSVPKTVLRWLWNVKLLKAALGVSTEDEVRDWFYIHQHVLNEFNQLNEQFVIQVRQLQTQALRGLQETALREQLDLKEVKLEPEYMDE